MHFALNVEMRIGMTALPAGRLEDEASLLADTHAPWFNFIDGSTASAQLRTAAAK